MVLISLISHCLCWTIFEQVKAHAMQFFTYLDHWHATMRHIMDTCQLTKFDGELQLLHEAENDSQVAGVYSNYSICEMKWMKYLDEWPCLGLTPGVGHLSWYVTSHPGQLSLAIPSWVGAMSTKQTVVTPCSWGVNAGMVRVWMAGKTVWSYCYIQFTSERSRAVAIDKVRWLYMTKHYTNSRYFTYFTLTETVVTITAAKHGQHVQMQLWYTCTA